MIVPQATIKANVLMNTVRPSESVEQKDFTAETAKDAEEKPVWLCDLCGLSGGILLPSFVVLLTAVGDHLAIWKERER